MFLMTSRTGFVLHHAGLVKGVLLMAGLTLSVDWIEGHAVTKTVAHDRLEFVGRQRPGRHQAFVMALRAVVRESGMAGRYLADVEKGFASPFLKKPDGEQPGSDGQKANGKTRAPPRMQPIVVAEIAFVALGDLLLGASRLGHR